MEVYLAVRGKNHQALMVSNKRKKQILKLLRGQRCLKRMAEDARRKAERESLRNIISADPMQQVPNNSCSPPPTFYEDLKFVCSDCGASEIWTAEQQKWYYEVAKGSLYATAVRCRDCRQSRRAQRLGRGDPSPIKHLGSLLKRIRMNLEPALEDAGFRYDGKSLRTPYWLPAWVDYSRPGLILRCRYDSRSGSLIAETLGEAEDYREVINQTQSSLPGLTLVEQIDEFTAAVREFVRSLPAVEASAEDVR